MYDDIVVYYNYKVKMAYCSTYDEYVVYQKERSKRGRRMRRMRKVGVSGLVVVLLGFILNYGWEMLQMPAYRDRTGKAFEMSVGEAALH